MQLEGTENDSVMETPKQKIQKHCSWPLVLLNTQPSGDSLLPVGSRCPGGR